MFKGRLVKLFTTVGVYIFLFHVTIPSILADTSGDQEPLKLLTKPQPKANPTTGLSQNQPPQLYDIYGPVSISESFDFTLFFAIVGGLLVALLLGYLFLKNRKTKPTPALPPWETALLDLQQARSLKTQEQSKAYMDRASLILRHYIERRFSIKSTRQTTSEFLNSVQKESDSALLPFRPELQLCLERADMAKFAGHNSTLEQMSGMEEDVSHFINKTKLVADHKGRK